MLKATRERVKDGLGRGLSQAEIARDLGLSKATIAYHARALGSSANPKFNRRYDWAEVQRFYEAGNSITDCQREFGFARKTFMDAVRRGDITTRPQAMPIDELLGKPSRNRSHIKIRLISSGLKENACEECGISQWLGHPLSLELHHVNGDGKDHRLENLQLLCPNCHSQTDTWGGRNRGRLALVDPD